MRVAACHGYILDSTPVPFTVDGSEDVVTVVKYNSPQMGVIRVSKTGGVFTSVTESDGLYTPVYETGKLAGATFTISAAEGHTRSRRQRAHSGRHGGRHHNHRV